MLLILLREWMLTPFTHYRLFHNFAKQDFLAQFTASIGGFLWLIITPIIHIMIYAFVFGVLFNQRAAAGFEESTFVVFMMVGFLPWFAFADSIGKSTGLLIEKAPLITKVKFPVQIIPVVGSVIPYLTHAIGFGILLAYLATQGYWNWMWFYLPFIFFFQFLFTLGLVAILSALSVFLRDLQQLVALGITVWFFLTPIIWPISIIQDEAQRNIFLLNPMHSFISLYREIVLLGQVTFIHLEIVIPVSIITYFFGGWLFMKIKQAFGDVL
jgi:lipopolysaccharide transport system permease protein|tara:strand:- start:2584 stop:3390 length:807 start_codon:yes stop_codon:yes gene_type:complete